MNSRLISAVTAVAALIVAVPAQTAEPARLAQAQKPVQPIPEEPIYASHMMTEQERDEHRARLRAATTEQERDQIRRAHHDQMRARAKARGMTLPDEPPLRGQGLRPGPGPGLGTGPGSGAAPGGGR